MPEQVLGAWAMQQTSAGAWASCGGGGGSAVGGAGMGAPALDCVSLRKAACIPSEPTAAFTSISVVRHGPMGAAPRSLVAAGGRTAAAAEGGSAARRRLPCPGRDQAVAQHHRSAPCSVVLLPAPGLSRVQKNRCDCRRAALPRGQLPRGLQANQVPQQVCGKRCDTAAPPAAPRRQLLPTPVCGQYAAPHLLRCPAPCRPGSMAKRALMAGCNYPGTNAELRGCINDCHAMRALLTEHFGFQPGEITMMLDTDASTPSPTGANIKVGGAAGGRRQQQRSLRLATHRLQRQAALDSSRSRPMCAALAAPPPASGQAEGDGGRQPGWRCAVLPLQWPRVRWLFHCGAVPGVPLPAGWPSHQRRQRQPQVVRLLDAQAGPWLPWLPGSLVDWCCVFPAVPGAARRCPTTASRMARTRPSVGGCPPGRWLPLACSGCSDCSVACTPAAVGCVPPAGCANYPPKLP